MKLEASRKSDLAIRALRSLRDGQRLSTKEIAERIGTSTQYAAHVMAALASRGWVSSTRGPGGGYELDPSAHSVSVLDVIEAIEGPIQSGQCVLRPQPCEESRPCVLHEAWTEARRALSRSLAQRYVLEREDPS